MTECWFREMTTSSMSLRMRWSCGLMWKVSAGKYGVRAGSLPPDHR